MWLLGGFVRWLRSCRLLIISMEISYCLSDIQRSFCIILIWKLSRNPSHLIFAKGRREVYRISSSVFSPKKVIWRESVGVHSWTKLKTFLNMLMLSFILAFCATKKTTSSWVICLELSSVYVFTSSWLLFNLLCRKCNRSRQFFREYDHRQ